jgi:glutamate-ammonia-ligase adenylyltransferase
MTLTLPPMTQRITRLPRPFEADRGDEALAATPWAKGDMAALIRGTGGSSPYLLGLIEREGDWLEQAVDAPEEALDRLIRLEGAGDGSSLSARLRRSKRRLALLTALCDLSGVWKLPQVTGALTDFADAASQAALEEAIGHEIRRGKLPGANEDDIPQAGGMVTLAMGKMGAHELNYSSDIDLICLFDETRFDPDDFHEARSSLVRARRARWRYAQRSDRRRLCLSHRSAPASRSVGHAGLHGDGGGRTLLRKPWPHLGARRLYQGARRAAGDLAAGARFLKRCGPFVWRKHLDFAAIEDAHNMRLRIREAKGLHGPITVPGHNMKLGAAASARSSSSPRPAS